MSDPDYFGTSGQNNSDSEPEATTPTPQPEHAIKYDSLDTTSEAPATPRKRRAGRVALSIFMVIVIGACVYYTYAQINKGLHPQHKAATSTTPTTATTKLNTTATTTTGLQLDANKNYGNKYANGLLPVGDGKYSTTGAKKGYVYTCTQYAHNLQTDQGGAGTRGPWFTNNNTQYDLNKKAHVSGSKVWQASFSNTVSGTTRTLTTNDLPDHPTGVFPIASTDAAYAYDRNPNTISSQNLSYSLPTTPTYGNPNCMGGQSGVMLTGVALFNGFDAGGRDAGAWEVQDNCDGHPEKDGLYHYHTLSSCIKDISVSTVIGFALDGFPITGPTVGTNNVLTTDDLDECHGIVSQITLDKKPVTMYHYVMTQDFPYSVSCFRATATQTPGAGGGQQQTTTSTNGGGAAGQQTPPPRP